MSEALMWDGGTPWDGGVLFAEYSGGPLVSYAGQLNNTISFGDSPPYSVSSTHTASDLVARTGAAGGRQAGLLYAFALTRPGGDLLRFEVISALAPSSGTLVLTPDGSGTYTGTEPATLLVQFYANNLPIGGPTIVWFYSPVLPPPTGYQPVLRVEKVIGSLPPTIVANTIYFVRVGDGYDTYVSDSTGAIAHALNLPASPPKSKSVTLSDPVSLERVILFNQQDVFNVSEVHIVLPGASATPSVTLNIGYGTDVSLPGTELWVTDVIANNTTVGQTITTIDNPVIPDNVWVWLSIESVLGVVPNLHVTLKE